MVWQTRTDNARIETKLELRRHFLRKYHAEGPVLVFDACQGSGLIWRTLRKEFRVDRYWGVDVKPKAGRVRADSTRILAQPGLVENVIDVDTYGEPWAHYFALLPNVTQPTTVFLTASVGAGMGQYGRVVLEALGLGKLARNLPPGFQSKSRLGRLLIDYCLTLPAASARLHIVELAEGLPASVGARYFGARLEPMGGADGGDDRDRVDR